jgi:2-polyprenyl-3-methyl-5-hydroxy-6-metoxy-1,4-benzoquinol methylase
MEHVCCNLCGADDAVLLYPSTIASDQLPNAVEAFRCTSSLYGKHFNIVRCRQCGLGYTNPRLTTQEIMQAYKGVQDPLYVAEYDGRALTFRNHLRRVEQYKAPPGKLLDVGAYSGVFVEAARARGWDAWGLEPCRWAVEQARSRGLSMIEGSLDDAVIEEQSFDVVTMWDVIEHVTDPLGQLTKVRRLLKPGGLAVIHTMDLDSLFARLMGGRWPWLMEMHIFYFTPKTLGRMAEAAGLTVVKARAEGRYLRLGYVATRVGGLNRFAGKVASGILNSLGLREVAVPLNFGDLFTLYATR